MTEVVLRVRAERDIQTAYNWYEEQQPGLGEEYLLSLQKRLEAIRKFPESCPVVYRGVRRAMLARFPYLVFYIPRSDRIVVLAILHMSRDPAKWPKQ